MDTLPKPWWNETRTPTLDSVFSYGWVTIGLSVQRLNGGPLVMTDRASGYLPADVKLGALAKEFEEAFPTLKLVLEDSDHHGDDGEVSYTYISPETGIEIYFDGDKRVSSRLVTTDRAFLVGAVKFFKDKLDAEVPKGRVNVS
jgi:hypothetical protein